MLLELVAIVLLALAPVLSSWEQGYDLLCPCLFGNPDRYARR
jgi:hypothetical protein